MTKHLKLLLALKDLQFQEMKTKLANEKHLKRFREIHERIERLQRKYKIEAIQKIDAQYKEKINEIINEKADTTNFGTTPIVPDHRTGWLLTDPN